MATPTLGAPLKTSSATVGVATATLGTELDHLTRRFLRAPYQRSPLGEGKGVDSDPPIRMDAFDCTTFVETALALAQTGPHQDLLGHLDAIRYLKGERQFKARRHLIVAQWIPGLTQEGYLIDVSREVAGPEVKTIVFELNAKRWARRRIARSLALESKDIPMGQYIVPVVPLDLILKRANAIEAGTIINAVRMDVPWSPVLVTHQGLIFKREKDGALMVRHASPVARKVIDEPLRNMVRRYKKPRAWPFIGFNLQRVVKAAPGDDRPQRPVGAKAQKTPH